MQANTKTDGNGSGIPAVQSTGTTTAGTVSDHIRKMLSEDRCPDCGAVLRFSSRDPCEGDYYFCPNCDNGPILYPLNYTRKFVAPVIDSDECNRALALVARVRGC